MTSAIPTRFRFASLLSDRIVGWSRPSSAQQPSRTKGVTLPGHVFGVVLMCRLPLLSARAQETSGKQLGDLNVTQIRLDLAFLESDPNARV